MSVWLAGDDSAYWQFDAADFAAFAAQEIAHDGRHGAEPIRTVEYLYHLWQEGRRLSG
jgi:hypothetical protein